MLLIKSLFNQVILGATHAMHMWIGTVLKSTSVTTSWIHFSYFINRGRHCYIFLALSFSHSLSCNSFSETQSWHYLLIMISWTCESFCSIHILHNCQKRQGTGHLSPPVLWSCVSIRSFSMMDIVASMFHFATATLCDVCHFTSDHSFLDLKNGYCFSYFHEN